MAIDQVNQATINFDTKQEVIVLMDDYGATFEVYVPTTAVAAARTAAISDATTLMQANQAAMESYATEHGIDISAKKLADVAAKKARYQGDAQS
jgi:hypothetical protein